MGISTVSGPFRSKNGFQQLDENGQWVPVTGGGGGTVIVFDETTTTITLNFTEVGQVITLVGNSYEDSVTLSPRQMTIDIPLIPGVDSWVVDGAFFEAGGMGYDIGGIGTSPPIALQAYKTFFQFSFVGIKLISDPGGDVLSGSIVLTGMGKFGA